MAAPGRKTTFEQKVADEILERISAGEPLAVICRDEGMPKVRTVSDWKAAHPDFAAAFARAREEGADALAAQCLQISDDEQHDWKMTLKGPVLNDVAVGRAKLQVETRLKLLAKWFPKRYGDRIEVDANVQGEVKVTIGGDA